VQAQDRAARRGRDQARRNRVKSAGLAKPFSGSASRPGVTDLVSASYELDGPAFKKTHAFAGSDVLPQPQQTAKTPPDGGGRGWVITHRTQKSAVNPLTRLASRTEIRRNFQSPHVEGPAATFDPCLTDR